MSSDPKQLPLVLGCLLWDPLRNKEPLLRNLVIPVGPTVLGFGKPFGNLIRGSVSKESSPDFLRLKDLNLTDFSWIGSAYSTDQEPLKLTLLKPVVTSQYKSDMLISTPSLIQKMFSPIIRHFWTRRWGRCRFLWSTLTRRRSRSLVLRWLRSSCINNVRYNISWCCEITWFWSWILSQWNINLISKENGSTILYLRISM